MRIFILATISFLLMNPPDAFATSCGSPTCAEHMARNDLIFSGKSISSGKTSLLMRFQYDVDTEGRNKNNKLPNTYTDFEVQQIYKGVMPKTVRIFYETRPKQGWAGDFDIVAYPDNHNTMIYAIKDGDIYKTYRGMCSGGCPATDLEIIKAQYDTVEQLIISNPQVVEFYLKKISLYESNTDFHAAASTYERLFTQVPSAKNDAKLVKGYETDMSLVSK